AKSVLTATQRCLHTTEHGKASPRQTAGCILYTSFCCVRFLYLRAANRNPLPRPGRRLSISRRGRRSRQRIAALRSESPARTKWFSGALSRLAGGGGHCRRSMVTSDGHPFWRRCKAARDVTGSRRANSLRRGLTAKPWHLLARGRAF